MTTLLEHRPASVPLTAACAALGVNRSTVYARAARVAGKEPLRTSRRDAPQSRALSTEEKATVLDVLNSDTYCDQPPYEVYQSLLEQGQYLCSVSTMHRILRAENAHGERRAQRPAQHHAVPRLRATTPNEVWTWDISKLPTVHRGHYLSLYVVLDLFSRYCVAWMVSRKENSALARQLMAETMERYGVTSGSLTVHQDRGAPMTAHAYLDMMADFGTTCSHSRPRVSNDNPYSESQFKTQKGQPDYPGRFEHSGHASEWCAEYFHWYNTAHHHSGLNGYTPQQVFTGSYIDIAATRQQALDARYASHPERFVNGPPRAPMPPTVVEINPAPEDAALDAGGERVNFPTLTAAKERPPRLTSQSLSKRG